MKIATMFQKHFWSVCDAHYHPQSNIQAEQMNGKVQLPLEEATEDLKTSGLPFPSFKEIHSTTP